MRQEIARGDDDCGDGTQSESERSKHNNGTHTAHNQPVEEEEEPDM